MTDSISVDVAGVHGLGDIHTGVASGLGSLVAAPPGSLGVSHGPIASAVDTALAGALGSRSGAMTDTQAAGSLISELLHQSAIAYERGDQTGGDAIRAAADQISQGEATAGTDGTSGAAGGGTDALGQAMGQIGQLAQMGQLLGAPLAALAQPLTQLPQALMQGLQQMPQSTSGAEESATGQLPAPDVELPSRDEEVEPEPDEPDDEAAEPKAAASAESEPAPMPEPAPERPAPTRPDFFG